MNFSSQSLPKDDTLISDIYEPIMAFSKLLQKHLAMDLFGYDLIVNPKEPDIYYLVDINYFPSYHGVPNRIDKICRFIIAKITHCQYPK